MFRDISFYNKVISFIILVVSMIVIKSYSLFLLIAGLLLVLAFMSKRFGLLLCNIVNFTMVYFLGEDPSVFVVLRCLLPIFYLFLIEDSLFVSEKRFLYDSLFYHNKRNVKSYINRYYFDDCYDKNLSLTKEVEKYVTDLKDMRKYKNYIEDEAYKKTKKDINRKYLLDKIRFDRYFNKKMKFLPFEWGVNDNIFLIFNIIVLVCVLVVGR